MSTVVVDNQGSVMVGAPGTVVGGGATVISTSGVMGGPTVIQTTQGGNTYTYPTAYMGPTNILPSLQFSRLRVGFMVLFLFGGFFVFTGVVMLATDNGEEFWQKFDRSHGPGFYFGIVAIIVGAILIISGFAVRRKYQLGLRQRANQPSIDIYTDNPGRVYPNQPPNQVNPNQPSSTYPPPQQGQNYPQPNPNYPQPAQNQPNQPFAKGPDYPQPGQGYPQPNQTYPQPNQTYPQPNQTYPQPNQTYPQPNQTYPQQSQNYPQPNQPYPSYPPNQPYPVDSTLGFPPPPYNSESPQAALPEKRDPSAPPPYNPNY